MTGHPELIPTSSWPEVGVAAIRNEKRASIRQPKSPTPDFFLRQMFHVNVVCLTASGALPRRERFTALRWKRAFSPTRRTRRRRCGRSFRPRAGKNQRSRRAGANWDSQPPAKQAEAELGRSIHKQTGTPS